MVAWERGVAARLAGLSLTRSGRLSEVLLCSDAVHCGLLVDLALAGRLEQTDEAVLVDDAPTGFGPADDLLELLVTEPDRSLGEWIEDPRVGLAAVVDALVDDGGWSRQGRLLRTDRYRPADEDGRRRDLDLAHVLGIPDPAPPTADDPATTPWRPEVAGARWPAADAAVGALAGTAAMLGEARERGYRLPAPEVPERVLASTGTARWVCEAAIAHLAWARQWRRYRAGVLNLGDGTPG